MPRRFTCRALFRLGLPLCGWLSLALFVFIVSGLPIPLPFAKDLSRPFPCMFSQCGCRDADQCWRSCCCHSATERVAWANKHRVEAPEFLRLAAEAEPMPAGHVARLTESSGSTQRVKLRAAGCCNDAVATCCESSPDVPETVNISLIAALKCQGNGATVAGVPLCLPPPRFDWQPIINPLADIGPAIPFAASPSYDPAIPPPRSLV